MPGGLFNDSGRGDRAIVWLIRIRHALRRLADARDIIGARPSDYGLLLKQNPCRRTVPVLLK